MIGSVRAIDIPVGYRHERLTVVGSFVRRPSGEARFPVQCDCGTELVVPFRGKFSAKSCGCYAREQQGKSNLKHGDSRHPLSGVWRGMRSRCSNPKRKEYKNYGGRGIKVCSAWDDFTAFRDWALEQGWVKGLDIDRIDNDGDYSPENCRIVSRKENLRHTRHNRYLEAFGERKTMVEWAEDPRCVVSYKALESRLRRAWTPERAVSTPVAVMRPKMGE